MKVVPPFGSSMLGFAVSTVIAAAMLGAHFTGPAELPELQDVPRYERAKFGEGWADLDGDCQDTRTEVLVRDLDDEHFGRGQCKVLSGVLNDPYTGRTLRFDPDGGGDEVHIDHVIPLAYAWRGGAWHWSDEQRRAFANDEANLLAVDGPTNTAKGDSGPAEWMPPNTATHCDYAARWSDVLRRYDLAPTTEDAETLWRINARC